MDWGDVLRGGDVGGSRASEGKCCNAPCKRAQLNASSASLLVPHSSHACLLGGGCHVHSQSTRPQSIWPVQVLRHPKVPQSVADRDQQRQRCRAIQMGAAIGCNGGGGQQAGGRHWTAAAAAAHQRAGCGAGCEGGDAAGAVRGIRAAATIMLAALAVGGCPMAPCSGKQEGQARGAAP